MSRLARLDDAPRRRIATLRRAVAGVRGGADLVPRSFARIVAAEPAGGMALAETFEAKLAGLLQAGPGAAVQTASRPLVPMPEAEVLRPRVWPDAPMTPLESGGLPVRTTNDDITGTPVRRKGTDGYAPSEPSGTWPDPVVPKLHHRPGLRNDQGAPAAVGSALRTLAPAPERLPAGSGLAPHLAPATDPVADPFAEALSTPFSAPAAVGSALRILNPAPERLPAGSGLAPHLAPATDPVADPFAGALSTPFSAPAALSDADLADRLARIFADQIRAHGIDAP